MGVLRRVGPFPNQSNTMKGTYKATGTTGLTMEFTDIQTDQGKHVELENGLRIADKQVVLDCIYSSKTMLAFQSQEEDGECDFYVCTPLDNIYDKLDSLTTKDRTTTF